jgi:hypothetical protein
MPKPETTSLTDHLLALGATSADARALAALAGPQPPDLDVGELILRVLDLLPIHVLWRVVTAWLPDIERTLPHGARIIEALRAVVAPATVDAERHDLVIEARMGLHPEDGSGPPTDPALNAVGSAVFVLGQVSKSPRLASSAVSNLLGVVMERDREAGERCLRALWNVAAAGVAEGPREVQ